LKNFDRKECVEKMERNRKIGYLCILVTTLLFSSMEVASKLIAGDFNPIQITFTRFLIAGILLLPMAKKALRQRGVTLAKGDYGKMAALGALGILFSMTFYQLSILYIDASVVAVLFSCNPLFVMFFAVILLGEEAKLQKMIALAIDIVGIIVIIQPWNLHLSIAGVVFILIAAASFALYGVLGKKQCAKTGGIVVTCGSFLFGSVEMMLVAACTHLDGVANVLSNLGMDVFVRIPFLTGYTMDNILVMAYLCLICTSAGYACYFVAMEKVTAQEVSMIFFFKPILAPIMAAVVLSEEITHNMLMGIALILIGSLLSIFERKPKAERRLG
jgi:drug/metabolite transporter (DMT)-like permease